MKSILIVLTVAFLATSCVKDKEVYLGIAERAVVCDDFEDYVVPVKAGYVTIVTNGSDTLAVADKPVTLKVPKGSIVSTKGQSGFKVDFAILENYTTYQKYWQAVMFEDTESGDYDYNDLIIHVSNFITNGGQHADFHNISIQPIALGSIKNIKLGCILGDNSEHIISENVRVDLFDNKKGFINTEDEVAPIRYKLKPVIVEHEIAKGATKTVAWFVEVSGKRYYAVTSDYDYRSYDMFNAEGMPYGLVVGRDNETFNYPQEEVSIFKAYPDFGAWINGRVDNIGVCDMQWISKYCKPVIPGEDGVYHKIWDYLDLQ